MEEVGSASDHTVQTMAKRKLSKLANSSAEELVLLNTQMEELSGDMKQIRQNVTDLMNKSQDMMTKNDMKAFIKSTLDEIMNEINKNIELTIDLKLEEKTKQKKREMEALREENNKLKQDLTNV